MVSSPTRWSSMVPGNRQRRVSAQLAPCPPQPSSQVGGGSPLQSRPGGPTGSEGARSVSCEQPGQAHTAQPGGLGACCGGGGRAHHTGPVSGLSPRLESEEPAPRGCRAGTSAAAHTPVGRGWPAGLLPEAQGGPGTCPPESSLPPSSQHPHRMPLLSGEGIRAGARPGGQALPWSCVPLGSETPEPRPRLGVGTRRYLNPGHHGSGDPRLATHPGGFSCGMKGRRQSLSNPQADKTDGQ